MANVTPTYLRGFLVPLALGFENVWEDESSYSTAEERAGDPEPQQNSAMQLIAKGRQSGDSDLTIDTTCSSTAEETRRSTERSE